MAKQPKPPSKLMASFPGQAGVGPSLPNQVQGLTAVVVSSAGGGSSPTGTDPVTVALNATGSGTRYDVHTASDMDTTPWATLGPGDVVNIFPGTYPRKFGLRAQGTAANPVIINGVTDSLGNRPVIGGTSVTTCLSCNPSGGFSGATDIFHVPAGQYNNLGMITILHGSQDSFNSYLPKYITIQNLDITGAQPNNTFTDIFSSTPQNWSSAGSAGVWYQRCDHPTLINCRVYDNGFGIFAMSKGDGDTSDTPNILIEAVTNGTFINNKTFGNGVLTSANFTVHGWYLQGGPHTVMGNYIGQNRVGSAGSSYKSRTANEVFAYNFVVATARACDWVHTEGNNLVRSIPGYGRTDIYGNVFLNDLSLPAGGAAANPLHFGCDNTGEDNPTAGTFTNPITPWTTGSFWDSNIAGTGNFIQPRLQFYLRNNTHVTRTPGSTFYKIHLFDASLQSTLVDVRDSIFVMDGAGLHASWMQYAGRLNLWGKNLVFYLSGAAPLLNVDYNYDAGGGAQVGIGANGGAWWTVNIANPLIVGDPLFANYAANDFHLSAGSPAIGQAAGAFPAGMTFPPTCGFYAPSGAPQVQTWSPHPDALPINEQFALNNQEIARATTTDLGAFSPVPPSAPADFFVTLQGQTAQNASTFNPTPPPSFNLPNEGSIYLGWPDSVPGAFPINHYEIQHSTDGGTTWTTPTGGASISTAAADAQGTRYKDLTCPNSVGSSYGPTTGQYLPATVYLHRLRAVDTQGNASAWVVGAKQYIFNGLTGGKSVGTPSGGSGSAGGGYKWGGDLSSGYPINYAVPDPTYGFVATIDMSAAGGGYFLPTTGCNYCTYNQQVGACDYIYFLLKTTNPAMNISMHGEVVGDLKMLPGGAPPANLQPDGNLKLAAYVAGGTVLANTYQQYQVPLKDFMTPQAGFAGSASAIGVLQTAMYKFLWQANAAAVVTLAKAWVGK